MKYFFLLIVCGFCLHAIQIERIELKGEEDPYLEELLNEQYRGCSLDSEHLKEIKSQISGYFQKKKCPFTDVCIPEQDVSNGVLTIDVSSSKVGQITIEGNHWSSTKVLQNDITLKPGEKINLGTLRNNLEFINSNPFRRADAIFTPGKERGTTDLVIHVDERERPYRFYVGADNTGVETIRRQRLFTGFNIAGDYGWDHFFTFQYTSSYNFRDYQAYTAQYIGALPWQHLIDLYGGYSYLHANLGFPASGQSGHNGQASCRYIIPFGFWNLQQRVVFGFDFKRTNNTLAFSELLVRFGKNVNLTQLMMAYQLKKHTLNYQVDLETEFFWSPGKLFADQTNQDFSSLQPGAKDDWIYNKTRLSYLQYLPHDFSLFFSWIGQISSQTLLPSEQIGLGGHDTVRGYDERQLNYDGGMIFNFEARTPHFPLITAIRNKKMKDALQFLTFIDFGWGHDKTPVSEEPNNDYLMSIGPGLRYVLDPYISARFDWGIKLHQGSVFTGGGSMVHFSMIAGY
jgi:hemolysin activation/secretion protein